MDFKDLISHYLLPKNKLVDPELLSNILAELSLINFSLTRNLKMIQRLNSLLRSKTSSTRSGLKCFVRTWQCYRETSSGVVQAAPAFWAHALLQSGVFITTTLISEKCIYPNGIMSTAILFFHCRAPQKTPTDTRNSTGIYF